MTVLLVFELAAVRSAYIYVARILDNGVAVYRLRDLVRAKEITIWTLPYAVTSLCNPIKWHVSVISDVSVWLQVYEHA